MDYFKSRKITRKEAERLLGNVFDDKSKDFETDGSTVMYNDGCGTIWEETIGFEWSDTYATYLRWQRHRGEAEGCYFTDWEPI